MGNQGSCGKPDGAEGNAINAPGAAPSAADEDASGRELKFEINNAKLRRSFAKVGYMNPYAVLTVDAQEVFRTPVAKSAHKEPIWNAVFSTRGSIPDSVTISVWDKNSLHKDVFCGDVTIPCSADMGRIEGMQFELHKRQKPTGTLVVTLEAEAGEGASRVPDQTGGVEMDLILGYVQGKQSTSPPEGAAADPDGAPQPDSMVRSISMRQKGSAADAGESDDDDGGEAADDAQHAGPAVLHFPATDVTEPAEPTKLAEPTEPAEPAEPPAEPAEPPAAPVEEVKPQGPSITDALGGSWKCVATQGLDEFLIAAGKGVFERKFACAAKWPSWDFLVDEAAGKVMFTNNASIGILKEDIVLDKNYMSIDGWKNKLDAFATWTADESGGMLLINKSGTIGKWFEERKVTNDTMVFLLTNEETGKSWGRTFERVL